LRSSLSLDSSYGSLSGSSSNSSVDRRYPSENLRANKDLTGRNTSHPTSIIVGKMMLVPRELRASAPAMPITITEDSDDDYSGRSGSGRIRLRRRVAPRRCVSLPCFQKSIMKYRTLDESLHSAYGSEDGERNKYLPLQFDKVQIREYSRTVGDNPSCSSGPPVSISWEYNIIGDFDVDGYERSRPMRRIQQEMVLPRYLREDLLRHEWDVSRKEIAESVRTVLKVKNQRKTTINNQGKAEILEEALESACRKLKRLLTGKKSIHKQVIDLEKEIDLANRRRSELIYLEQTISRPGEETAPYRTSSNNTSNISESS
jgi:hypothetical protein